MIVIDWKGMVIGATRVNAAVHRINAIDIGDHVYNVVTVRAPAPSRANLRTYELSALMLRPGENPARLPGWEPNVMPWPAIILEIAT